MTKRLEAGDDPLEILGDCRTGMTIVGERFQEGGYFLGELLDPHLVDGESGKSAGVIVLANMRGDIHDLGKNIFATLLNRAQRVHSALPEAETSPQSLPSTARLERQNNSHARTGGN